MDAKWTQAAVVDPIQKERDEKAIRGMRMNLRKICLKLLSNKTFKHFHLPVLETDIAHEVKEAYRKLITHPMDLATMLQLVDSRVVKCKAQFVGKIELIVANAMTFNGPDGPDAQRYERMAEEVEAFNASEGENGRPYSIPVDQDEVLRAGSVLECHLEDPVTRELDWFTCKVTSVSEEQQSFEVHIVIENSRERGGWRDTYPLSDQGTNWRWPSSQAAMKSRDASARYKAGVDGSLVLARQVNDQICSLAHELRDEVEDLFEKLDSWLVTETDRIVEKLGGGAEDPEAFGSSLVRKHTESIASSSKVGCASSAVPKQNGKTLTRVPVYVYGTGLNAAVRKDGVLLQLQQGVHVVLNGEIMTLHQFEKAAGNTSRRPRESICLSETGQSLAFAQQEYKLAKVPNERTAMCMSCDKDDNPTLVLFCSNFDKCGGVSHTYCLKPALKNVPDGDWFCPGCPVKAKAPQMYLIPENQPHVFDAGFIVELRRTGHVDDADAGIGWIPARISRPPQEGGGKMQVHAVSNFGGHAKEMKRDVEVSEEGTTWRWPRPSELELLPVLGSKRPSSASGVDGGEASKKRKLSEGGEATSSHGGDVAMGEGGEGEEGAGSSQAKEAEEGAKEEEGQEMSAIEPVSHEVQDVGLATQVVGPVLFLLMRYLATSVGLDKDVLHVDFTKLVHHIVCMCALRYPGPVLCIPYPALTLFMRHFPG